MRLTSSMGLHVVGLWQCLEIIARGLDEALARLRLHVEDT
jgi:hypothetical protein